MDIVAVACTKENQIRKGSGPHRRPRGGFAPYSDCPPPLGRCGRGAVPHRAAPLDASSGLALSSVWVRNEDILDTAIKHSE